MARKAAFFFSLVSCWCLAHSLLQIRPRELHVSVKRSDRGVRAHEVEAGNACVSGWYAEEMENVGWNFLAVTTKDTCQDLDQAYGAGYVEGALTSKQIWQHWNNMIESFTFGGRVKSYFEENQNYISQQIAKKHDKSESAAYWWQVQLALEQTRGLADGYKLAAKPEEELPEYAIFVMNADGDLYDLKPALDRKNFTFSGRGGFPQKQTEPPLISQVNKGGENLIQHGKEDERLYEKIAAGGKCSAVVKLAADNSEVFTAQMTFTGLEEMLRIYKKYDFQYKLHADSKSSIPGQQMTFSSYPGHIYSGDDFYITNAGVVAIETTIGTYNFELYDKYITPYGSVLEWIRNLVANRLAKSGREWVNIFSRYNSGTYNNQWLIVDYNKFQPGKLPENDTLMLLEQYPGHIEAWDATPELREKGFVASYNSPANKELFILAGWQKQVDRYGDFFTHDKSPRAKMFARDHHKVKDLDTFKRYVRYNKFKKDPLGACKECTPPYNGEFGLSSRGDLNPANGTYPFLAISHRDHSSIDAKVTSSRLAKALSSLTVSGPTCDDQPVFDWQNTEWGFLPHKGHPDRFEFPWVELTWGSSEGDPWLEVRQNSSACSAI